MDEWLQRLSHREADTGRGFNSTSVDSHYQRDRARIIHCASFRSLQSKTQVLGLGESDFYRTRLTHSLEVAQIGSGICEWLRNNSESQGTQAAYLDWIPSFSLIEAICLAHDIGHSPFGHGGEVALNYMMKDNGGFEANGQTLRILSKLGEYSADCGLDLTRRTQLGTIKYPCFYSDTASYPPAAGGAESSAAVDEHLNIDRWAPPKCLYDEERPVLEWILEPFESADRARFAALQSPVNKHKRSIHKSFDTSIMELADDIAYGVHDLEDALALGLVSFDSWQSKVADILSEMPDNAVSHDLDFYNKELFSGSNKQLKHAISKLVGFFIRHISVTDNEEFQHPLLRHQASMDPIAYKILLLLKQFVMQEVILRPELQTLQYKGQQVVIKLFDIFANNPRRLLPTDVYRLYQNTESSPDLRAIADYIAAMTDVSAARLYHKLLTPTAGSIFDRT